MADVVSDVFLSFFCCCCYAPGDHHGMSSTHNDAALRHHHRRGGRSSSKPAVSLQTVELKVRMCCEGCERVVRHALSNLRGVDSVEVDVAMEKVRVTGYVDRGRVLQAVRRSGKKAEFWPAISSMTMMSVARFGTSRVR
uniref:HMA domain-containing protein n=1 Tax=Leersia perrieri TaxID=77586 RepID=A0A0D9XLX5_9ORYZ